jgi:hypothetical protein
MRRSTDVASACGDGNAKLVCRRWRFVGESSIAAAIDAICGPSSGDVLWVQQCAEYLQLLQGQFLLAAKPTFSRPREIT